MPQTCLNSPKPSEKLVAVTPINKDKRPLLTSTRVKPTTSASGSKPSSNTKNNRITRPPHSNQKNKVEDHPRKVKSSLNKTNSVFEPISNALVKHSVRNAKFESICAICNKCLFDANHDLCLVDFVNHVNVRSKSKSKRNKKSKAWKPTGKVFTDVGYKWKPTGRLLTIVGNSCPLTRITPKKIVHIEETTPKSIETLKLEIKVYSRRPKQIKSIGSSKKAKIVESKIANNSKPTHLWGSNATDVPSSSSLFNDRNDQVAKILGYGDYQQGNVIISRVNYVEGLRHNLFSVGQFCDVDLEVAFRKNTCFIRNLEGVDLLSGSRDTNLYTVSLNDMLKTSPICLLSKASKTKSWLWHRRLLHLNFACTLGKSKKLSHQPKAEDTNQETLYLLHMDLCGPMRVESINGKKYILVIVDDYSRFTWVKFLRSKDEAPDAIIKCTKNIQVRLNAIVHNVRTDNGTEYVNQTLRDFYENLMHDKKLDLSFFHVFGLLCYPTNDSEDLGKLNAKVDIGIFFGYAPVKKAFRMKIMKTIHVTFDELTAMVSEQFGSEPGLQVMTPATSSSGLVPKFIPQQPCNPPKRDDWDTLFQPLFNEYFNPPTIVVSTVQVAAALRAIEIADPHVSTSIDQDAPSSSIPSTHDQEHSPILSQGVEESPKTPLFHDEPLHEFLHEDSTSQGSSSNVRPSHTPFELIGRWTKDHPIANVIGDPSRSVSTRKQLKTDAMWCYFDAFLTYLEPKNFKQEMTK
ncbi:integrase, catalytic region, zinc finger, CCHC-type containing protein [Tanacetum coccineum]